MLYLLEQIYADPLREISLLNQMSHLILAARYNRIHSSLANGNIKHETKILSPSGNWLFAIYCKINIKTRDTISLGEHSRTLKINSTQYFAFLSYFAHHKNPTSLENVDVKSRAVIASRIEVTL